MAQYEMKNSIVSAWQWDGTVPGAQAIQAQFGDAQEMSFYQSAKASSVPSLQIRDGKAFSLVSAAPSFFVIMMADGKSVQVMESTAFTSQYSLKPDDASSGSASSGATQSQSASTATAASPTNQSAAATQATPSNTQTASTSSAVASPSA